MTESAAQFVGAPTFAALTGRSVATKIFDENHFPLGAHIELATGAGPAVRGTRNRKLPGEGRAGIRGRSAEHVVFGLHRTGTRRSCHEHSDVGKGRRAANITQLQPLTACRSSSRRTDGSVVGKSARVAWPRRKRF